MDDADAATDTVSGGEIYRQGVSVPGPQMEMAVTTAGSYVAPPQQSALSDYIEYSVQRRAAYASASGMRPCPPTLATHEETERLIESFFSRLRCTYTRYREIARTLVCAASEIAEEPLTAHDTRDTGNPSLCDRNITDTESLNSFKDFCANTNKTPLRASCPPHLPHSRGDHNHHEFSITSQNTNNGFQQSGVRQHNSFLLAPSSSRGSTAVMVNSGSPSIQAPNSHNANLHSSAFPFTDSIRDRSPRKGRKGVVEWLQTCVSCVTRTLDDMEEILVQTSSLPSLRYINAVCAALHLLNDQKMKSIAEAVDHHRKLPFTQSVASPSSSQDAVSLAMAHVRAESFCSSNRAKVINSGVPTPQYAHVDDVGFVDHQIPTTKMEPLQKIL